ncbi:putative receptor protein kinase ZmPK1 [Impatiens glandulifera]|uniref:putative receptor protein kinase ZmPK1 n=1 Tax=Impatiens glandulifera TaxID=253017 RepID=UPI001FB10295|nr:putative receptor protein kinase ZmPK1 [Impatiens glandulifera]
MGDNAFWFSIWFTDSKEKTVVWTANRDKPVNGMGSKVTLRSVGALALLDIDGSIVWETNTSSTNAERVELLNSGNLVLKNPDGKILWQSFDFPTDTLLPSQSIRKGKPLVSSLAKGSFASGFYKFYFDNDNTLKLMYEGPEVASIYWPNIEVTPAQNGRSNFNNTRIAVLDNMGRFSSSDAFRFNSSDMGFGVIRRLTMDYDGNLRLYSLDKLTGLWEAVWHAVQQPCNVNGLCGRYAICVYAPQPICACPLGYEMADRTNWNHGCRPKFNLTCSSSGSQNYKFVQISHADYYGFDSSSSSADTLENCRNKCQNDCSCKGFSYRIDGGGSCFIKYDLFNGRRTPSFPGSIYIKLPADYNDVRETESTILNSSIAICGPSDQPLATVDFVSLYGNDRVKEPRWGYLYGFASAVGIMEILFFGAWWLIFKRMELPATVRSGYQLMSSQFRRFGYSELKKSTKNFKEELGRGGSGIVYKGELEDGRTVAVKRLGGAFQGEEVFWAEVTTIGKIYHMNLLRMWGFCAEANHRLVVYEFVENGSLEKRLFFGDPLGWKERFQIAIGMAKGLAYLHHECLEWVIHCDVKPENILLDSHLEPKIADFGLAKLSQRGGPGSEFTRIRGTKGYMAPEWATNLPITAKVDVYSYGVVILELVRGVRLSGWAVDDVEEQESELTRFLRTARRKLASEEDELWVEEVVDPKLKGVYSRRQATKLIETGLSCVEEDRTKRPTMASVLQVLVECEDETKPRSFKNVLQD